MSGAAMRGTLLGLRKRKVVDGPVVTAASAKAPPPPKRRSTKGQAKTVKSEEVDDKVVRGAPDAPRLDPAGLDKATVFLTASDAKLATMIEAHGKATPLLGVSEDHFKSLVRSIVFQQLAPAAASAIFGRFVGLVGGEKGVSPLAVQGLEAPAMRAVGLSERKASYILDLADFFGDKRLSDSMIDSLGDEELMTTLTRVRGIGPWSVHMFMMFKLGRPDVLPVGDLGVRKGFQTLYGLKNLPDAAKMEELSAAWRPYRSVGSFYMWRAADADKAKGSKKKTCPKGES